MTKEQIAQARRLASDMGFEPSHPEMNRAGDVMDRLLDEREALLEALRAVVGWTEAPATKAVEMSAWIHGVKYQPEDVAAWDVARAAIAKAEAE